MERVGRIQPLPKWRHVREDRQAGRRLTSFDGSLENGWGSNTRSLIPTPTPNAQKRRAWAPRYSRALPIHAKSGRERGPETRAR
jgi:hypothetical protein